MTACVRQAACLPHALAGIYLAGPDWLLTAAWRKGTSARLVPDLGHLATRRLVGGGTTRTSYSLFQTIFFPRCLSFEGRSRDEPLR